MNNNISPVAQTGGRGFDFEDHVAVFFLLKMLIGDTCGYEFPAMEAGGPYQVSLVDNPDIPAVVLDDILIGDVWMCSGQSNMQMPLWGSKFWRTENGNNVAATANYPNLRFYNSIALGRASVHAPEEDENGPGWQPCTPETAELFSACGFYFGVKLMKDLNIPIGLISTAWGGTDISSWISQEKYEQAGC